MLASYKIAYHVALCKKLHTLDEELILKVIIVMVSIIVGKNAAKKLWSIPLSTARIISNLAIDTMEQLAQQLKEFVIHLDEGTDIKSYS